MNLEQMASAQGIFWAEREYLFLCLRERELPVEWHGTLDQARHLAGVLVNDQIEPEDRDRLARLIQEQARLAWVSLGENRRAS
jgi:hypothetical protein